MVGLNESVTLSFMVVGHTEFTPDSCFRLFKQRFRRTHVQCLDDISRTVDTSATVSHVKLVGNEQGQVFVPTYNWLSFFAPHIKKVSSIKQYHQFHFSSSLPSSVMCKEYSNNPGTTFKIQKQASFCYQHAMPSGLSPERDWYLYDKIQPYCNEEFCDTTCPLPTMPRPNRTSGTTPTNSSTRHRPGSPHQVSASPHRPVSPQYKSASSLCTPVTDSPPAKRIHTCLLKVWR